MSMLCTEHSAGGYPIVVGLDTGQLLQNPDIYDMSSTQESDLSREPRTQIGSEG